MIQPEYIRIEHKTIQDPCTALKAIDTTLKKITTLESAIKLEKHHDQWNPLYIGIGIGITILSAIGIAAFCYLSTLTLPFSLILLAMFMGSASMLGIVVGPIATFGLITETLELKETRQNDQKALQEMINPINGYNFSDLNERVNKELTKAKEDEHGSDKIEGLLPLVKITATDYFNLFKRAETALAFN